MSYYRPVRLSELIAWLVDQAGVDPEVASDLAQKLVDRYDLMTYAKDR